MDKKELPACMRTGKCCSQLNANNTQSYVKSIRGDKDERRKKDNHTDMFLDGWNNAAIKAINNDTARFACPFLKNKNVCTLQDNKPDICSGSLTQERLTGFVRFEPWSFFHEDCGYLDGPEVLRESVRLSSEVDRVPLSDKRERKIRNEILREFENKYINTKEFCYKFDMTKGWYKAPKPTDEERSKEVGSLYIEDDDADATIRSPFIQEDKIVTEVE